MKIRILIITLFVLMSGGISAQTYQKTDYGVKTVINYKNIEIYFYNPYTVRVLKYPQGKSYSQKSLSVIQNPQKTSFKLKQKGDELLIKGEKLDIYLSFKTGKLSFATQKSILLSEKEAGTLFTDFIDAGTKTYSVSQSFILDKNEAIYGLGQQQEGKMSKRNVKLKMVQGNTDDYVPFFVSNKGYGLFWDNYSPTVFEDTPENTTFTSEVGDGVDYYFMAGTNADGVIANMRSLTGQAPMFPLWTYGFWQSKERYQSQDELVDVVEKYRELGVPLDGIIQDWQYWGDNEHWNAMEFLNPHFYNPQKMVNDVHGLNAHMVISIWASFGKETKPYVELEKTGALFNFVTWPENPPGAVKVYDPYNPEAREIYWKYLNKGIFSLGMDGWWMDSTEPDHLQFKPSDMDNKTYLGSFRKVRNAFPLMTVGGVSDHQRSVSSDKRVFILTRSVFAGQQRYGSNTWTGDVLASWEALKNQISAGLNLSLSGIPYWNSDIGGFFLWNYKNPLKNPDYRELYTRWLQFGTFTPMMRSHGTDAPREIYQFGQKGEKVYDAVEKYINLRYSLLPYIYASSWEVTNNHSTMTRALVMDFAEDKQALDINDEFMFGKSILVSPVTQPMYSKLIDTVRVADFSTVKSKDVYLPKGVDWFDFWTAEKHVGGQTVKKAVPIDITPMFVKAGSILPFGPKVQFATEKKWDNLEIRIYEGANGDFTLYEDENDNYNYEKGAYSTIKFLWNDKNRTLTIDKQKGSFLGTLKQRKFNIVLVSKDKGTGTDLSKKYDREVIYSGKRINVKL
jgi:alpha-D-xyloside xylohydrolase